MASSPDDDAPGGRLPIAREDLVDGDLRPPAAAPGTTNRMFTPEEMRAAFGPHPMADWKPVIRGRRRRR